MIRVIRHWREFALGNAGAITVDYVVLTAAAAGIAVATHDEIRSGLRALAGNVNAEQTGTPLSGGVAGLEVTDGFENGVLDVWSGGEAFETNGAGVMLGKIGGTGGAEQVTRQFKMTEGIPYTTMSFDVVAFDELAGASGIIYIGGQEVGRVVKNGTTTEFIAADIPKVTIKGEVVSSGSNIGGKNAAGDQFTDSRTRITLSYETPDPDLTFGFGSNGPADTSIGSFAIDDFKITGVFDPDGQAAPPAEGL
jgi:hypothetical protein